MPWPYTKADFSQYQPWATFHALFPDELNQQEISNRSYYAESAMPDMAFLTGELEIDAPATYADDEEHFLLTNCRGVVEGLIDHIDDVMNEEDPPVKIGETITWGGWTFLSAGIYQVSAVANLYSDGAIPWTSETVADHRVAINGLYGTGGVNYDYPSVEVTGIWFDADRNKTTLGDTRTKWSIPLTRTFIVNSCPVPLTFSLDMAAVTATTGLTWDISGGIVKLS
jgi:hypothetical protein